VNHVYQAIVGGAFLTVLLASTSASGAQNNHYRWLNERGRPVYSDRPPPKGVDYEVISTNSARKRMVSADEGAVPAEVDSRVGNEFEEVDPAEAARFQKNPVLCDRARTNLDTLDKSDKIKTRNDQGEVRNLTDEEIIVERQTAKAQISVYCE
jgi:hypothetical protein